jgi:SAM-dependent methyltransferase
MNFFAPKAAAERYAHGRPYFHPLVIDRIKTHLGLTAPVERAIDVGCGTGLSTLALKPIAKQIVGVDSAVEMLALAPPDPAITYAVAPAEHLPVADHAFDLMTLCSVFHWVDRVAFLAEARRVLQLHGWLVVYDNYFTAQMAENVTFHSWAREVYLHRYPSPPRARTGFTPEDAAHAGFDFAHHDQYDNEVRLSVDSLINYLVTQSNIIAAVEGGRESLADVQQWLREQLLPLFDNRTQGSFKFRGLIWYLQRAD